MPRQSDGFTLIESLVATGLLATIALGSAQLFTVAIARNLSAREELAMSLLASTKVDDLTAQARDGSLAFAPAGTLERDVAGWFDRAGDNGRIYVRRWRVERVSGFTDDTVAAIVVRVAPEAGAGALWLATVRERRSP